MLKSQNQKSDEQLPTLKGEMHDISEYAQLFVMSEPRMFLVRCFQLFRELHEAVNSPEILRQVRST